MGKSKIIQSKNIVISTQCFPPEIGGIENLMEGLSNSLLKNKFKLFVFADSKNRLKEQKYDKKQQYEIIRYKGIKIIRRRRKSLDIKKFISIKKNVHFIICDTWKSAENLIKIVDLKSIKILCLAHGNDILTKRSLIKKRRLEKVFSKVKYIIANSYFTRNKIKNLSINSSKIKVIYPGINRINLPSKKQNLFGKYNYFKPILITIARLEKRKNHIKIIYAINELLYEQKIVTSKSILVFLLLKEYNNLLYLIAGDGPEKKRLSKIINKLNLNRNVKLLGKVNEKEKASLFNISDLHIMPTIDDKYSHSIEGFGISYIEAGMFGVPSISSGIGGTKESVINNKTGIICDPNNIFSIKNSIKKILNDQKNYKKISVNAKNFSKRFIWDNVIKSYIDILKKDT